MTLFVAKSLVAVNGIVVVLFGGVTVSWGTKTSKLAELKVARMRGNNFLKWDFRYTNEKSHFYFHLLVSGSSPKRWHPILLLVRCIYYASRALNNVHLTNGAYYGLNCVPPFPPNPCPLPAPLMLQPILRCNGIWSWKFWKITRFDEVMRAGVS